jgi:hypothetical protein
MLGYAWIKPTAASQRQLNMALALIGVIAVTASAALGALVYFALASRPSSPSVDRPVATEVWWLAYSLYIHLCGIAVVLCGLGALLTGSLNAETLLAELPRRADRKIVYFAYTYSAFYLAFLAHALWRRTLAAPSSRQ